MLKSHYSRSALLCYLTEARVYLRYPHTRVLAQLELLLDVALLLEVLLLTGYLLPQRLTFCFLRRQLLLPSCLSLLCLRSVGLLVLLLGLEGIAVAHNELHRGGGAVRDSVGELLFGEHDGYDFLSFL